MGKTAQTNKTRRIVGVMLVVCMVPGIMLSGLATSVASADGGPVGDIIFNYPFDTSRPPGNIEDSINWTAHDHNSGQYGGYDQAYTKSISQAYNGIATPNHVVFVNSVSGKIEEGLNNSVAFYGYGIQPYMDYVFADEGPTIGNAFFMRPVWMDFHSFSECGYLFNGNMKNGHYTGYAVILQCENSMGMQESNNAQPNTGALRLYYINNEKWDTETFSPGSMAGGTRTLVATFKTGIKDINKAAGDVSMPFRVSVEIDPSTRAFEVFVDGSLRASVPADGVMGGPTGPTGFGFYAGYYEHDCPKLTRIRFEEITTDIAPAPIVPETAKVRFVKHGTSTELRLPETADGYVGQGYRITQPAKINVGGIEYSLVENSQNQSIWNDIHEMYRNSGSKPDVNVTTLYYLNPLEQIPAPGKKARVDGGNWDNGTHANPVPVKTGNEIEYRISLYRQCTAMMHNMHPLGFRDLDTYGYYVYDEEHDRDVPVGRGSVIDPYRQNYDYDKVTVVSLPENIKNEADFLRIVGSKWNGKDILSYWDFTETDPLYNSYSDTSKVYVWVTESSRLPNTDINRNNTDYYDMFVGGGGGVILTPAQLSFTLKDYDIVTEYDPETNDPVVRIVAPLILDPYQWGVFAINFINASEMNLGWLDTSQVTDFRRLFAGSLVSSATHKILDLSGFDFSNVTLWDDYTFNTPGLSVNINSEIHVGSAEAKAWLQGNFGSTGKFADYNPETSRGILVLPTGSPSGVTVTDAIPNGLSIIASSITNGGGITHTLSGQTIIWEVPASRLPVDLSVKATVGSGVANGSLFENTAAVDYGAGTVHTNTTYHKYFTGFKVAEKYFIYDSGPTTTKLGEDLATTVDAGGKYSVLGSTTVLNGFTYCGYSLDGGTTVIHGNPPTPVLSSINADKEVRLYYQRSSFNTVTIHYVNEDGIEIKAEQAEPVPENSDYYLPMSHMKGFSIGTTAWTYYDFKLSDTVGTANQPVPASPNYPVSSNAGEPVPIFANIVENQHITLYFTSKKAVIVKFVEHGNTSHILHNTETYFMSAAFDPGSAFRHEATGGTTGLTADISMESEFGKTYKYDHYYSINGGAAQNGTPGTQTASCEITLFFETTWTVVEMFVSYTYDKKTGNYFITVFDEEERRHADLPGGYAFYALDDKNAALPDIPGYKYAGYHFERVQTPMIAGAPAAPLISGVYADYVIIYVYEPETNLTGSLKISKTLSGDAADPDREFHFVVTFGNGEAYDGVASGTSIALKGGESRTITGIPHGVAYAVSEVEANSDGYATTSTGASGTVSAAQSEASFTNSKNSSGPPVSPGQPEPTGPTGPPGSPGSAPTGDNSGIVGWIIALISSMLCVLCILICRKRRHFNP